MYTLSTGKKARWYGLLTAGYMAVNEEYSGYGMTMDYSVSMPTFAIGIGWEKLLGFKKNKGLAFEAGYQIGSADYDIEMEMYGTTTTLSQTYKASPLYLGGSYTFYFKK